MKEPEINIYNKKEKETKKPSLNKKKRGVSCSGAQVEHFFKKTPQELAAQVDSISYLILDSTNHPDGAMLDQRYREIKDSIQKLLESGIDNEQLGRELAKLYKEARKLGIYSPLEDQKANEFFSYAKKKYLELGYSETDAEAWARKELSNEGYLAELRKSRRTSEDQINEYFKNITECYFLEEPDEAEKIEQLRERVIDLSNPEQIRELAAQFPGGNFLYHGTRVEQIIKILESGNLSNIKRLHEIEEMRIKQGPEDEMFISRNSGYEGISWNFNKIGALPGDRYHLAGFLSSPQDILSEELQLAIPSRPAPHELILLSGDIDSAKFYSLKTQHELLNDIGPNSVFSNICLFPLYLKSQEKGEDYEPSILQTYIESITDEKETAEILRALYSLRDNGTISFSPELLQQKDNKIPVAAVWLQALIDTGRIRNVRGFKNVTNIKQAIERIKRRNYKELLREMKKEGDYLDSAFDEEFDKITPLSVSVSQMYLVIPDRDLEKYLRVLVRCKDQPKGILVYNDKSVRLENFASIHKGDDEAMTELLRRAIPSSDGYIDYEQQILGTEITPDKMTGYRKHVISDKFLPGRNLRKNNQGHIVVV